MNKNKKLLFWFLILFGHAHSIAQKKECNDLKVAYAKKDVNRFEKSFKNCLRFDSCVITQISLIVFKISNNTFSEFDIYCLSVINENSDGYASEFLFSSLDKIFKKNHDKFLLASYIAQKRNRRIDISKLIIEGDPFIKFDIHNSFLQLAKRQESKNLKFAQYLYNIVKEL